MDERKPRSRHADSLEQSFRWALLPTLLLVLTSSNATYAQGVTTNITPTTSAPLDLGTIVDTVADTVGSTTSITGGTRPGSATNPGANLFHSFDFFTLGTDDTAHFLNDMQLQTNNIFVRVIGGEVKEASTIDGTLRTNNPLDPTDPMNFGAAHLWLVNPSGVLLGPNARVEVGGSVSMSTANYLRFEGTGTPALFDMLSSPASLGQLSVAPVVAFGFLGPQLPAPITVEGSFLTMPEGQSLSLIGGDVTLQGAFVSAPSGRINIVSVGSPGGEVQLPSFQTGPNIDGTAFDSMGTARGEFSTLDVSGRDANFNLTSGANSGTVFLKGGQLVLDGSFIYAGTFGEVPGASTAVEINASTVSIGSGTLIWTDTSGDGNGGNIMVWAETLSVMGEAAMILSTTSFGKGQGGNVEIRGLKGGDNPAELITLSSTSGPAIATSTGLGSGQGGHVSITATDLTIENGSAINTDTCCNESNGGGAGVGGNISLNIKTLTLKGGSLGPSEIRTSDFTTATDLNGDGLVDIRDAGGNVNIQGILHEPGSVAESVTLSGGSQILSATLDGNGGLLSISATVLSLKEASTIQSRTDGKGRGGGIELNVQHAELAGEATIASRTFRLAEDAGVGGSITVQGQDGDGSKTNDLMLTGLGSRILSETFGSAAPGNIEVNATVVSLENRAAIEGGSPANTGTGGEVTINADSVEIVGGSHISSQAFALNAGTVTITANQLKLDDGSIETSTASETGGSGGPVVLNVGTVSLTNGATINSSTSQTGPAGDITMTVGTLSLANGSSISSASTGTVVTNPTDGTAPAPGTAGNVVITATGSITSDASTVKTSAEANHGGDISITAASIQLSNGTVITASSKAPLEVKEVVLIDGQLVEQVVGAGNAGNITVHSGSTFVMTNSSMTTEASQASGGQVVITAPEMVQLINSKISTSVGGLANVSDGGNITIDPQFVILQNSQIIAQAFAGAGGAIEIVATSAFIADPNSIVDASSTLGISGIVNIQSPLQNVGGELPALSEEFSSAAALLAQQCAARAADGKFSTFVVAAREGLPMEPGGFLASPSLTPELLGTSLSWRDRHSPIAAVTGAFQEYNARPIQLAKLGNACR